MGMAVFRIQFPEVLRTPCRNVNVLSWGLLFTELHGLQLSFVDVWFVICDHWLQEIDLNVQNFS